MAYLRSLLLLRCAVACLTIIFVTASDAPRSGHYIPRMSSAAFASPPSSPRGGGMGGFEGGGPRGSGTLTAVPAFAVKSSVQNTFGSLTGTGRKGGITWKDALFDVLALIAVCVSPIAILTEIDAFVAIASVLAAVLGPAAAVLQNEISEMESLREITNDMKGEVTALSVENKRLTNQNVKLADTAKRLQKAKSALEVISKTQGVTVDWLVDQVNEYKMVQDRMRAHVKVQIQQNLLSAVISSDTDGDFFIDPGEIDVLAMRLSSMPGVQFDEKKFRKALAKSGMSIDEFSRRYLKDRSLEKDRIFVF